MSYKSYAIRPPSQSAFVSTFFSFSVAAFAARFAEDQLVAALITLGLDDLVSVSEGRLWAFLMLCKVRMESVVEMKVVS